MTKEEKQELKNISEITGKSQSQLIREAVDRFIESASMHRKTSILKKAAGLWKQRDQVPDLVAERSSWDRS